MKRITNLDLKQLLEKFEARAEVHGWKDKKLLDKQLEFLTGAIAAYDVLFEDENEGKSSISPLVYISLIRGTLLKSEDIK